MGRSGPRPAARRQLTFAVLAVLVLVSACGERSRVDPNARVEVAGSVVDPTGAPLALRPVHLGAGISDSEVGLAILTVGVSCAAGGCRGKQLDTTTAADGTYAFTLKGSDTRSTFGEAVSELVTATAAPGPDQVSGAAVSARFKIQTENVRLPVLHLVDPGLSIDRTSGMALAWSTPSPGPYEVTFEDGSAAPVWDVTTTASSLGVDPRVLEGTTGRVVLAGASTDRIEGSDVDLHWRSPGLGYVGVGAPPSRGRPCQYVSASGTTTEASPCGLTDGNLATAAVVPSLCAATSSSPSTCDTASAVDIELGTAAPAELVVIRGCGGSCPVSVSADGTTFTPVGAASTGDATVALDGSPITTVRVGLDPATPPSLREVSVWGATPSAGHAAAPDLGHLRSRFGTGASGDDLPTWLVGVAAALLAALLVALGVILGRRSRATGRR